MTMWLAALAVLVLVLIWPTGGIRRRGPALFRHTGPHWRRNYGRRSFLRLGLALGAAAVLAHSGADTVIEARHARLADPREGRLEAERRTLRLENREDEARALDAADFPPSPSDRLAGAVKPMGERELFLVWGLAALGDWLFRSSPFSRWGRRTFEAMCVGLPVLWTVQRVLGSNRPMSRSATPRWQPMAHANAASGHAFMAAIPWWTLADRLPEGPGCKAVRPAARLGGLLTGWSRLNDRMHYPSQILLGWVIAGNAVVAARPPDGASTGELAVGSGAAAACEDAPPSIRT